MMCEYPIGHGGVDTYIVSEASYVGMILYREW